MRHGTIVDASIFEAPLSAKNRAGERDPKMHHSKKGNQGHFGMKAHIGVDSEMWTLWHSMSPTATNVHDVTEAYRLPHGERRWCGAMPDTRVFKSRRRSSNWG